MSMVPATNEHSAARDPQDVPRRVSSPRHACPACDLRDGKPSVMMINGPRMPQAGPSNAASERPACQTDGPEIPPIEFN